MSCTPNLEVPILEKKLKRRQFEVSVKFYCQNYNKQGETNTVQNAGVESTAKFHIYQAFK